MEMAGVFWGAFDLTTKAHLRIISVCLEKFPIDPLILVVNNHSYKRYKFPLQDRIQKLLEGIPPEQQKRILLYSQEDSKKMNYQALAKITDKPLCAIAGYDAYRAWIQISNAEERTVYHKILVIPRGDEIPLLFDERAELLPIEPCYRFISSTRPN